MSSTRTPRSPKRSSTPAAPSTAGRSISSADDTIRRLNLIAAIAVADAVLLGFLLWASFSDNDTLISILGPIHGAGFLALLFLCIRGAAEERWGWWFPAIVLVTLGPPGSLIGDVICRRRIAEHGNAFANEGGRQ